MSCFENLSVLISPAGVVGTWHVQGTTACNCLTDAISSIHEAQMQSIVEKYAHGALSVQTVWYRNHPHVLFSLKRNVEKNRPTARLSESKSSLSSEASVDSSSTEKGSRYASDGFVMVDLVRFFFICFVWCCGLVDGLVPIPFALVFNIILHYSGCTSLLFSG